MFLKYIFIFTIIISFKSCLASSCRGCVELDELNFDKLLRKFKFSLIKFDIAFPYGDKHEEFAKFSKEIVTDLDDILIGTVGVKDYGDRENLLLAERYSVSEKDFPTIILFKQDKLNEWIKFPYDKKITINNLKIFLQEHTNVYIGLDGCLKPLDDIANEFIEQILSNHKIEAEKIRETIENLQFTTEKEKKSKEIYFMIINKILSTDIFFIEKEKQRINKLLMGSVNEMKKIDLNRRLNVLQTFQKAVKEFQIKKTEL